MADDLHLIIANKAYSSWSMRPWIAMKAQGLAFRETVICLDQPDTAARIKAFSAAGKVPVLQHGDVTVWDSLAILEYLAETFPGKNWWPADRAQRAVARAISAEMHSGFTNLRSNMPMNVRKTLPGVGHNEAVEADVARISAIWRDTRAKYGAGGAFLFGTFTNADAMFAPVATRLKTYVVKLDADAQAYADALLAHPAVREWYISAAGEPWVIAKYEK